MNGRTLCMPARYARIVWGLHGFSPYMSSSLRTIALTPFTVWQRVQARLNMQRPAATLLSSVTSPTPG